MKAELFAHIISSHRFIFEKDMQVFCFGNVQILVLSV